MKSFLYLIGLAGIVGLTGCGGNDQIRTSSISGRVTYLDGSAAVGALVSGRDSSTSTNSNGDFVLQGLRGADQTITAEITVNNVHYINQTLARTYTDEHSSNINFMVVNDVDSATITGQVQDRQGFALTAAEVFAYASGVSGSLTPIEALTDKNGNYTIRNLAPGVTYTINAGGNGYSSDSTTTTFRSKETRTLNFILGDPGTPTLTAPKNLTAIAWTAPIATSSQAAVQMDAIKTLIQPSRARKTATRLTTSGSPIEVELEWDSQSFADLLGWNIYRATNGGAYSHTDYDRDPIGSVFLDGDPNLFVGNDYTYAVTTLATGYPDTRGTESTKSNAVTVRPMSELNLNGVSFRPLTFNWQAQSQATSFVVYLFNAAPGYNVPSLWSTESNPAGPATTSQVYTGAALQAGKTYYYVLLGTSNGNVNRTLSAVGSFVYQN